MDARNLVDWLAFTVPIRHELSINSYDVATGAHRALAEYMGDLWQSIVVLSGTDEWERRNGRSPYSVSFFNGHGVTVFVGIRAQNVLVEITGRGCEWLQKVGLQAELIKTCHSRMSRVDIATDIHHEIRPKDFVEAGCSKKFSSRGFVESSTGETVYIGSKKSERYCRVYRYSEPHERSHLMRIEYVFRKGAAKKVAEQLSKCSIKDVCEGAANIYDWEHELMKENQQPMNLKAFRPDRKGGKTLMWMVSQVAPAFRKLVKEGVISDPETFVRENFLTEKGEDDES